MRASLERAVADGRTLLERNAHVAADARVKHLAATPRRPRTVGAPGAVVAVSLGVGPDEYAEPNEFAPRWGASLHAIEQMRARYWSSAWAVLYGEKRSRDGRKPQDEFSASVASAVKTPPGESSNSGHATPGGHGSTTSKTKYGERHAGAEQFGRAMRAEAGTRSGNLGFFAGTGEF